MSHKRSGLTLSEEMRMLMLPPEPADSHCSQNPQERPTQRRGWQGSDGKGVRRDDTDNASQGRPRLRQLGTAKRNWLPGQKSYRRSTQARNETARSIHADTCAGCLERQTGPEGEGSKQRCQDPSVGHGEPQEIIRRERQEVSRNRRPWTGCHGEGRTNRQGSRLVVAI